MNKIIKIVACLYVFFSTLVLVSCKGHKENNYSVMNRIEAESKNYKGISISSEAHISNIKSIKITEGKHSFLIPERKSQIESYACSACHTKSITQLKDTKKGQKAHWSIKTNHAKSTTMNCLTCHNGKDMDNLRTLTNQKVDFNNSYNVCKQCHSREFEDWKGGAHGKQLKSWVPPRLSNTCVNCHNPHNPHFKTRYPSHFNTEYEKERK